MSNYKRIDVGDVKIKGFLVKINYNIYYVDAENLLIDVNSIMFDNCFYHRRMDFENEKVFYCGPFISKLKIIKIKDYVEIEKLKRVPEWVGKTTSEMAEEIKIYRKEKRQNSRWRKIIKLLLIGKK